MCVHVCEWVVGWVLCGWWGIRFLSGTTTFLFSCGLHGNTPSKAGLLFASMMVMTTWCQILMRAVLVLTSWNSHGTKIMYLLTTDQQGIEIQQQSSWIFSNKSSEKLQAGPSPNSHTKHSSVLWILSGKCGASVFLCFPQKAMWWWYGGQSEQVQSGQASCTKVMRYRVMLMMLGAGWWCTLMHLLLIIAASNFPGKGYSAERKRKG